MYINRNWQITFHGLRHFANKSDDRATLCPKHCSTSNSSNSSKLSTGSCPSHQTKYTPACRLCRKVGLTVAWADLTCLHNCNIHYCFSKTASRKRSLRNWWCQYSSWQNSDSSCETYGWHQGMRYTSARFISFSVLSWASTWWLLNTACDLGWYLLYACVAFARCGQLFSTICPELIQAQSWINCLILLTSFARYHATWSTHSRSVCMWSRYTIQRKKNVFIGPASTSAA